MQFTIRRLGVWGCALSISIAATFPFTRSLRSEPADELPKPDFHHLHTYFYALETSPLPAAKAIRQQIADGPARLAQEKAAARREGIPLDSKDLKRPSPPADQDAAPLYAQLEQPKHLDRVPLPYYAYTLNYGYSYTPDQLKAVQAALDSQPRYTAVLHAATDKPYCSFHRKSEDARDLILHSTPSYAILREVARRLVTESFLLSHEGHYPEAINEGVRGLRVAEHAGSDVGLIGYLVAMACDSLALSNMRDILYMAGPDREVGQQVQEAIAKRRPHLSLQRSIATDIPSSLFYIEKARKDGPQEVAKLMGTELQGDDPSAVPDKQFLSPDDVRLIANLLDAQEASFIHYSRLQVRTAGLPPLLRRKAFAQLEKAQPDSPVNWGVNLFGHVPGLANIDDQLHANEQVTVAAAAIMAVRGKTGAFPTQLPGTFMDPFTGKSLGYRREGADGFVVYSVGADRDFDGGHPGVTPTVHPKHRGTFFRYPPPPPKPLPPPPDPNSGYPSAPMPKS